SPRGGVQRRRVASSPLSFGDEDRNHASATSFRSSRNYTGGRFGPERATAGAAPTTRPAARGGPPPRPGFRGRAPKRTLALRGVAPLQTSPISLRATAVLARVFEATQSRGTTTR